MNFKEYDKLPYISASKMKLFLSDRFKFKKLYVDGVKEKKKKHTGSTLLGTLADFYLLRDKDAGGEEQFDDVFSLFTGVLPPPQFREFTDHLYAKTVEAQDDLGKQSKTFQELMQEAHDEFCFNTDGEKVKFKTKRYNDYNNFVIDFNEKAATYYSSLRDNTDKDVVTLSEINTSKQIVKKATESWVTKKFFTLKTNQRYILIKQVPIIFELEGVMVKGLLDYVIIDLQKKKIQIFDLKTLFRQKEFKNNYLRFGYWLSTGIYSTGIREWADRNGYRDFAVVPLGFIRVPTNFLEAPLITLTTDAQYIKSMEGFEVDGQKYKGVRQILKEIRFAQDKGVWDMEMQDYEQNGVNYIDFL